MLDYAILLIVGLGLTVFALAPVVAAYQGNPTSWMRFVLVFLAALMIMGAVQYPGRAAFLWMWISIFALAVVAASSAVVSILGYEMRRLARGKISNQEAN